MEIRIVLERLTVAGRKAYQMDREMHNLGYDHNPYFDIYGGIADAIYNILGERCDFDDSATTGLLSDQNTSDQQCADGLFAAYQFRNGPVELSDATLNTLQDEANRKGMQVQDMINLILAEWALRQQYARGFVKAV